MTATLRQIRRRLRAAVHRRDSAAADAGFTMIEVVVALVVFSVVAAASVTALTSAMRADTTTQLRVVAANLAQQDLAQAGALQYPSYPAAVSAHTVTVGSKTFSLARTLPTGSCPSTRSTSVTSMQVATTVSWPQDNGTTGTLTEATVIAC
jgi:prepilin-type N-terminal cleavage/methylation domain-containing protein